MKTITAGSKEYNLYWTRGKVEETGKNMETRVSGGGGGGATYGGYGATAPVSITSHTIVHDQIFVTDNQGKEHAFQLQGFNLACRSGNDLSVVWAIKKGAGTGPYIAVRNYTTANSFYNDTELKKIYRRPVWHLLLAILVCLFLGKYSNIFYAGIIVLPILWFMEGSRGAKKFKEQTDFNEFQ